MTVSSVNFVGINGAFRETVCLAVPEDRLEKHKRLSKPRMDEFYAWLGSRREPPKALMGKAIYYAESQRKYLERYLLDGRLKISNNRLNKPPETVHMDH
jgi:hypothetical protein